MTGPRISSPSHLVIIRVDKLNGTDPPDLKPVHYDYDYNFFHFVQSMKSDGDQHALLCEQSEV